MVNSIDKAVLLVMDVQPGVVDRLDKKDGYLRRIKTAVDAAHKQHMLVIYVVVGFRTGLPEVSRRNKSFSLIKESMPATMINPEPVIKPTKDDLVVIKHRVSAFSGSDLEVVLRAQNIQHLVLTGIATSGVVLSTLREAADKDFQLTVLSDLCADFDDEVHSVLVEKVFPRQAAVITFRQWVNTGLAV